MLNENPPVDCPKAGVEPKRLGVLAGVEKLPPKRLGVLEAPKAGVLEPPKRLELEAPKAGVLPNKEGVLAALEPQFACLFSHIIGFCCHSWVLKSNFHDQL